MHNHHPHPKFSIITVTYNAAKVLEDTIQSIVTQTYKNLEYIIVDGGSTDETLDIICLLYTSNLLVVYTSIGGGDVQVQLLFGGAESLQHSVYIPVFFPGGDKAFWFPIWHYL